MARKIQKSLRYYIFLDRQIHLTSLILIEKQHPPSGEVKFHLTLYVASG